MTVFFVKLIVYIIVTAALSTAAIFVGLIDRSGRYYHGIAHIWSRFWMKLFGVRVVIRGIEHLKSDEKFIYVSNHASMFDIPVVLGFIPDQIRIIFKKELGRIPIFGWSISVGHYISIDRSNARRAKESLERAIEKMKVGKSVLLFAEGTRTRDGKMQPFKRGPFSLAVRSGVPIMPLTINGSFRVMPPDSLSVHPGTIELILHPPVYQTGDTSKEYELKLMEQVRSIILADYVDQSEPETKS